MTFTKDPSAHPANGSLTEERLILVREWFRSALAYSEGSNRDYMMADAAKAIDELMAVRKTGQEPVYQVRHGDQWRDLSKAQYDDRVNLGAEGLRILYAAPQLPQPAVVDDVRGPLKHAYKELTPTFMRNHIGVFERYGIYPDGSAGIQAMRIALDGMERRAAMLQGAEPVQEWIPCSERMPNLDSRVLLYFPDYGGHIEDGCIGDEGDGPYHYFFDGDSLRHEPTHWMPLPAAPQQEVK